MTKDHAKATNRIPTAAMYCATVLGWALPDRWPGNFLAGIRTGRRPRSLQVRQDQLEAGRRRADHRCRHPGELLREPDLAAAAVRGTYRHQVALREGSARADPAEGAAGPVLEDGDVRHARRGSRCTTRCTSPINGSSRSTSISTTLAHRSELVQIRRHHQGLARRQLDRRQALRHPLRWRSNRPGLPQGSYDAKGLKPAETLDQLVANAKALTDANARIYGLALRGFAGAGQNMYIYPVAVPQLRRKLGQRRNITVNSPEAVAALTGTSRRCRSMRRRRFATGTGPTSPMRSRRARLRPTSMRTPRPLSSSIPRSPKS